MNGEFPLPAVAFDVIAADGYALAVRRHGNASGPRLVLSHGNGFALIGPARARPISAYSIYRARDRRHTNACHLLQAEVDLNTTRAWLGHASLDTTNIYAEIDLEMKAKAMALSDAAEPGPWSHVDIALLGIDAPEVEVLRHRSRPVEWLRALVHGHFVVDEVERLANRWNVDTGASFPGRDRLTLLHVNARRLHPRTFDVDEAPDPARDCGRYVRP